MKNEQDNFIKELIEKTRKIREMDEEELVEVDLEKWCERGRI